jgi:ribosomal protein S18 acetylase RimI-like enzyme
MDWITLQLIARERQEAVRLDVAAGRALKVKDAMRFSDAYFVRPLTSADIDYVLTHRERMFIEAGVDEHALVESMPGYRAWLTPRLADGRYYGWIAATAAGDSPVAGLGMYEFEWPPHPLHAHLERRGYVTNVFVDPSFRRRGLAQHLMQLAEDEGRRRGLSVMTLHATKAGRPLYEQRGWTPMSEMGFLLCE